ncbi:hypothetical protein COV16_05865, partial [Candidatus Woesearchaeota archaeon CG10_big_fil_rev_8_21_14_0_10_34_8]
MYKKIIPYMFIFLLCLTVVFAGDNSLTLNYYDENGNSVSNVAVWVFECTDRSCEELTGTLTSDLIDYDDSRSSNSVTITIPKETDSSTYYVAYAFAENTDQYLPHAYEGFAFSSGGDGEANVDLTLEKKEDCKSEIRSLSVYNVEEPYMPVTVDVEAGIDADTYSAFLLNDEVYPWGYDQNADAMTWYQDWYSSEVEVEMKVSKKWGGSEVYITQDTQTEDLNILAGESEEVSFTWTPTTTGEYRVVVTTTVTDDQCSSSEEDQASDYFTIVEAEDTSYCYTELQNLDVYDDDGNVVLTAQTGETYTVAFEKVSNSVDSDGNLEALETELEGTVFNEDGNVDYSFADTADANADTTNYETYSFEWTPVSEGENTITVNGIAADCPYSDNLDESLDITVDVEGEDIPTTDYEPSIISCDADPNPAYVGEDVQFDSTLSLLTRLRIWLFGYEVEYSWDFDDSETSSDEEPAHAYDSTGTYTATVTVTDSDGDYDTCSVDVEVIENEEPTVSCDFSGTTGTVGEELTLGVTASDSDGTIEQYDWDFGDGNVETSDAETTHNYESADTYTVTVEVTDNDGDTGSCSGTVEITEPENVEPTVSCDFSGTTGTVGEELTLEVTA